MSHNETIEFLPVSAVVPTRDRALVLARTLESLSAQNILPTELIIVDGSADTATRQVVVDQLKWSSRCKVVWSRATQLGAGPQRNQGVAHATQPFIWFFDDDILFESQCVRRLWEAISTNMTLGGVSAMIVNQRYHNPGSVSRCLFTLLHRRHEASFAGRVIGPAVNILPEDRDDLCEVVSVEWLNLGCTMYRRDALPSPPFDSIFSGYSLMEDVTLSLRVSQRWKLANVRTARIYHDSQPGIHKDNVRELARMELINRHYIMTRILMRSGFLHYAELVGWEAFQLVSAVASAHTRRHVGASILGKWDAIAAIRRHRGSWAD
jgi:glycosyltransferase involved in cell wall biosynthesis